MIPGPDKAGSWEAMKVEIRTLTKLKAWKVFPLTPDVNVFNSMRALKFKSYPDGNIQKIKSRFCFRGYQQVHGIDYYKTFTPFVSWTTVRILLIPSVILRLDTNQVDYTYDFLHTQLPNDTYVFMLRGFKEEVKIPKLQRSLYGLRQTPRNFFKHLKENLIKKCISNSQRYTPAFSSQRGAYA